VGGHWGFRSTFSAILWVSAEDLRRDELALELLELSDLLVARDLLMGLNPWARELKRRTDDARNFILSQDVC